VSLGETLFEEAYLLELAVTTGFYKRSPRKIDICNLLAAICAEGVKGAPSCNDLAASIETSNPQCGPSRQAVHLRLGAPLDAFIQRLLENLIARKISGGYPGDLDSESAPRHFANYTRVLVQDSTIINLPTHLFEEFSGVSNGHSKVCNARVQATYDLITQRLVSFSIDPYSKNDLAAAPELPIQAGDLVLRDRGYLVINEIQRHRDAGADCIYRHKTGTKYLDPQSGKPIDLAKMLRKHGRLDITVLLNNKSRTPVRLVSAPVREETANIRRMRAKKETHGHNPSKAVLELMDWTILITTIPPERANFDRLLAIYGLRWRIEVIFKAWKSHMKFGNLHRVSRSQMFILLKARLLLITCCTNILYRALECAIWQKFQSQISLLKLINFISAAPSNLLRALNSLSLDKSDHEGFYKAVQRYCCYDRRKRPNFSQIYGNLAYLDAHARWGEGLKFVPFRPDP
jgi:hypothetical protein